MMTSRRALLIATGCLLLSRHVRAEQSQNAVYWTATPPGRKGAVLFGYERIAAAVTPEIVNDGNTIVDGCQRVVLDMPANVKFPPINLGANKPAPILQVVSPATADRLRKLFAASPVLAPRADSITGIEVMALLMGEGQHNAQVTVGGVIMEHARSEQKPIDQLLTIEDVQSAWQPPDMSAVANKIGDDTMSYLLDLRDRVGPIGAHLEELYRQRNGDEIARFTADMSSHGVFSLSQLMQTDKLRSVMIERALNLLTAQGDDERFMFIPLGLLTGSDGMLAAFKAKGVAVAPRA